MKVLKGTEEFQMFQDFWKLYNDLYEVDASDEFCDKSKDEINRFLEKYKKFYIGEKLAMVIFDYVNHEICRLDGKTNV